MQRWQRQAGKNFSSLSVDMVILAAVATFVSMMTDQYPEWVVQLHDKVGFEPWIDRVKHRPVWCDNATAMGRMQP